MLVPENGRHPILHRPHVEQRLIRIDAPDERRQRRRDASWIAPGSNDEGDAADNGLPIRHVRVEAWPGGHIVVADVADDAADGHPRGRGRGREPCCLPIADSQEKSRSAIR
jgi:hypothetical protein